jgi:phosphoglycerate dehydrogenase-like enzyme
MLINTVRGALIAARAGIPALKARDHPWYLGGDVYEGDGPLFFKDLSSMIIQDDVLERPTAFPNTMVTSHQGFSTREALRQIANTCGAQILIRSRSGAVCTENLIPVGARQNHLRSERDDRPDVLLPSAIHLTPSSRKSGLRRRTQYFDIN